MKLWAFKRQPFCGWFYSRQKWCHKILLEVPIQWYVKFEVHSGRIYDVVSRFLACLKFKSTLYSTSSWINTWSGSIFCTTIPNYVFSHCTNSPLLATRKYDPGRIFTLLCRYRVGMRRKNRPNEISIHSKKLMSWKSASTSSLVLVNNSDFPTIIYSNSECLRVQ